MDEGPTLRRATPSDAIAIRDLSRAAYAKWVAVLGLEPRPMTAAYAVAVRDHAIDLLQVGGELAALTEMRPERDHLLVVNLAVQPAVQGRGYGRALLAHAEGFARSLRLAEVRLYTNSRFTGNLRLYGRLGYRVDHEEVVPGIGVAVHMGKSLS